MIYYPKSQPAPTCLSIEKAKNNGDYKCGEVLLRLKTDFNNKCYLCESKAPNSINVEHFKAHQGDKDLKFDWNNLFWACAHCNNTKLAIFDNILNCTNAEHQVEEAIELRMNPFPFEQVEVIPHQEKEVVLETTKLLNRIYNGHTKLKKIESANIRSAILLEIKKFQDVLIKYFEVNNPEYKERLYFELDEHLNSSSPFCSFKRWIIRRNPTMYSQLKDLF